MMDRRRWTATAEEAERQARPPAFSMVHTGDRAWAMTADDGLPQSFSVLIPFDIARRGIRLTPQ
jgi:hypothetical protein